MRTTSQQVQEVLLGNYDGSSSLVIYIKTASSLVDKVARANGQGILSSSDLALIEAYLAAHFYGHSDQFLSQKQTGRASGTFQGKTAMALDGSQYGQTAMLLDTTGTLTQLNKGRRVTQLVWLGTNDNPTTTE